jgi:hypothetical protein
MASITFLAEFFHGTFSKLSKTFEARLLGSDIGFYSSIPVKFRLPSILVCAENLIIMLLA